MSVILNTQHPEFTFKKKMQSLCYHAACESVAMGESLTGHIATDNNVADLFTMVLYGQKRRNIICEILYDIYDDFYVVWGFVSVPLCKLSSCVRSEAW